MNEKRGSRWPEWLPLREELRNRTPYGAPQVEATVRLNTNENPFPMPKQVAESIATSISSRLSSLNRYPDRDALSLRQSLTKYLNDYVAKGTKISLHNIWPANGSNEVLQTILLAFDGLVAGLAPSYSMHPLLAMGAGRKFEAIALRDDFTIDLNQLLSAIQLRQPKLFFLTTPNNPTGISLSLEDIRTIINAVAQSGGMTVVDEAYGEFSSTPSALTLLGDFPSLVVVRTMSKAFAFAGARIGYAIAREEVIAALQLVRLPYHLSSLTQACGVAALEHAETLLAEVDTIKSQRDLLAGELIALGFEVIKSDANFILFGGFENVTAIRGWNSDLLWRALLDRGVLIRDVGIPGFLRVTVGMPVENQLFLAALREITAK